MTRASSMSLSEFQHRLGQYVRDPVQRRAPAGLDARRVAVYGELVQGNL